MSQKISDNLTLFTLLLLGVIICIILAVIPSHGSNHTKNKPTPYQHFFENNVAYYFGQIEDSGLYFSDKKKPITRIRMSPHNASSMFGKTFDFCGDDFDMFYGKGKKVVITYDRVIHKDSCYELLGVNAVLRTKGDLP